MTDYDDNRRTEDNRRPEEIEQDLDRTRAEVSSTIDAIQSKLTPGQMMDQAFAYARTSLPADFGANLGNTIRDNPVPVALMGIGIAWLAMAGQNADGRARARRQEARRVRVVAGQNQVYDYNYDYDYDDNPYGNRYASGTDAEGSQEGKLHRAASAIGEKGSELKDRASEAGRSMMDKASELGHKISDSASSMTDRARNMTHDARERMQGSTGNVRARASELGHRSQDQYYRAKDSFSSMLEEQPLVVGVLGVAIGTLLGAALPSTRREDEMMGRTRDDLLEKAKHTASEQADRLKESAKHVAEVAKDEAKGVASDTVASVRGGKEDGHAKDTTVSGNTGSTKTEGTPGQHGYH
jgi:ElaB/YqjD/DUF883 family membrane-anchored ribosome-binding protein